MLGRSSALNETHGHQERNRRDGGAGHRSVVVAWGRHFRHCISAIALEVDLGPQPSQPLEPQPDISTAFALWPVLLLACVF